MILGLHHVTATVDDAQADLDFAAGALGLRLVKKTVNFDNHDVYHFYYGDEHGTPGTLWTTFPYKGKHVRPGVHGKGQITTTSFAVPPGSLDNWRARLDGRGLQITEPPARFGQRSLVVTDPSGLQMEVIEAAHDGRPWTGAGVVESMAIRGLHSVTLTVASADPTIGFMERLLGFSVIDRDGARTRVGVAGGGSGRMMEIVAAPDTPDARNGLGTVHHVAMAVADRTAQEQMRARLAAAGANVTPILDRQYFTSIYFREPGGILFEIATVPPGFGVDEAVADFGTGLKLPPWEESNRTVIQAGLARIVMPRPS
jgi:glyoxalase family protein